MLENADRIIDLSTPIDNDVPGWPTAEQVSLDQTLWAARDGVTMEHVSMPTHAGTHVDAPLHFIPEGRSLDSFSIKQFMGHGVAVDLTPKEPGDPITRADLDPFRDEIAEAEVVMLHTGWDEYYGKTDEYLFEFPYLAGDAARFLGGQGGLKAVGTEGLSVGGWAEEVPEKGPIATTSPAESHRPLLENGVIPIEGLRNVGELLRSRDTRWADFFYPPLNYVGTGGGSIRAFAVL
jgi:kynurenine formamidase